MRFQSVYGRIERRQVMSFEFLEVEGEGSRLDLPVLFVFD